MTTATNPADDLAVIPPLIPWQKLVVWAGTAVILGGLVGTPALILLRRWDAPRLETPDATVVTPNPDKAPAEFLSPIDRLAYFDPFLALVYPAWVVVSCTIGGMLIFGALIALPRRGAKLRLRDKVAIALLFVVWASVPLILGSFTHNRLSEAPYWGESTIFQSP